MASGFYSVDHREHWVLDIEHANTRNLIQMWEHYGFILFRWYTDRGEIEHCLAKLSMDRNPDGSISDVKIQYT